MGDATETQSVELTIPARDGYPLAATRHLPAGESEAIAVLSSATAVPRRFYRQFAAHLAGAGIETITYDYRGIGGSRPSTLRGFEATMEDWALRDMAGVVDWAADAVGGRRLVLVGHSFGGQVAGLLDRPDRIDAMVTFSAQSGHWRLQGGEQKLVVWFHVYATLPVLVAVFGYAPWSRFGSAEDLPGGVARQWARWCRDRRYLLGDVSLPLDRYEAFTAPVLAYSFGDDKWGTPESVDAMMSAYPTLERRHVVPEAAGLDGIGHMGVFRPAASALWPAVVDWLLDR